MNPITPYTDRLIYRTRLALTQNSIDVDLVTDLLHALEEIDYTRIRLENENRQLHSVRTTLRSTHSQDVAVATEWACSNIPTLPAAIKWIRAQTGCGLAVAVRAYKDQAE